MRRLGLLFTVLALVAAGAPATGGASDPPAVTPRPGPAVLYQPLADVAGTPFENVAGSGWSAAPLRVSGADAYAAGEYLYQDFVYDSFGANTTDLPFSAPDPVPPASTLAFGGQTGDMVYPTTPAVYGNDAGDLLEFRARLGGDGTIRYRVTLNTMLAADVAGVAIGIDTGAGGTDDWGYGIGSLGDLDLEHVVVTWGTGASLDGVTPLASSADVGRNQISLAVPLTAIDPAVDPQTPSGAWNHYVAVGLYDAGAGRFKQVLDNPSATQPGGAHGTTPPPIFNVGFRFTEPMGDDPDPGSRTVGFGHWREHGQAKALAARDIRAFGKAISLDLLRTGATISNVPETGYLNRLYLSRRDLGEGAKTPRPMLVGRVQPYAVYVPTAHHRDPTTARPLHLHMHSLSCTYNQYMVFSPNTFTHLGEQRDAFVLTPMGRGPDGWYHDEAELDVFEAWNDLAAHYPIDFDRVTVGGYSMGGYGTYRFASLWPDLFAKAFAIVGPADESILGGPTGGLSESVHNALRVTENLRNVPLMMWNGTVDELVPLAGVLQYEQRLYDLEYRHELDVFPADHFLLSIVDQWGRARDFLGPNPIVGRSPDRVVYRVRKLMDNATLGLVHDRAYWVSGITLASGLNDGLVDARSKGFGLADPVAADASGAGTDPLPHLRRAITWAQAPAPVSNALEVKARGVVEARLWVDRAAIVTAEPITLTVDTDRSLTLVLTTQDGSWSRTRSFAPGTQTITVT